MYGIYASSRYRFNVDSRKRYLCVSILRSNKPAGWSGGRPNSKKVRTICEPTQPQIYCRLKPGLGSWNEGTFYLSRTGIAGERGTSKSDRDGIKCHRAHFSFFIIFRFDIG